MKRLIIFLSLVSVGLGFSGCGYTTRSTLPSNLKTSHVLPFKNSVSYTSESGENIYLPRLEIDVRNKVIDRFLFDGALKIRDPQSADLVMSGELLSYQKSDLRTSENQDIEEYRIHITASIKVEDRVKNETRLTDTIVGEETYFTTGPNAMSETAAVKKAIEDLATRIVERVVDDW